MLFYNINQNSEYNPIPHREPIWHHLAIILILI